MKEFKEKLIVGIDHGYGNIKTADHCFKTGIIGYDAAVYERYARIWRQVLSHR